MKETVYPVTKNLRYLTGLSVFNTLLRLGYSFEWMCKEIEAISSSEAPTEKKKKHKRNKEKEALSSSEVPKDVGGEKGSEEEEDGSDYGIEESDIRKKKKDKEIVTECSDVECATDQAASKEKDRIYVSAEDNTEHVKKGKGKKNKRKNENGGDSGETCIEKSGGEAQSGSRSSKKRNREEEVLNVARGEGKKKITKLDANIENMNASVGDVETENNFRSMNEHLRNLSSKKSSERVKFASHVEVFHSDDTDDQEENPGNKLVRGKRFTREEDQILKDAVHKYIEAHKLGEKGLDMILQCRRHPNIRGCWKEIGAALLYRPRTAIYDRGHTLFERAESREWTLDEKAFVLKFYEKHGPDWKSMSQVLAKDKKHVKDLWRRTFRAGKWTQMEYQSLFHLVNKDLRMHVYEEKKSKHGMIRDNIGWQVISNRLATRTQMDCCNKWSGDITLKRWRQMVNHIGIHKIQSFGEQVEVLAKRYCPELLEVREALDSRPVVD
ncbi:hypothetical protein MKW98_006399 [Papaver atlanticum]|uniref:Myb-like domain-containing protein n=1 Tax=Papaver atlanticum TaxID=357466 RepID=A0AAD4RUY1_9MAGN|nr:hypothetical protein MKW98_006399 [Papaver atlanticum]